MNFTFPLKPLLFQVIFPTFNFCFQFSFSKKAFFSEL